MRPLALVLAAALSMSSAVAAQSAPGVSALAPAGTGGILVVDRALAKLSTHLRVLVLGAHPDDEDTTMLALVGTFLGGEAAYLALSRGEGGQNLIGPELDVGLGLIRTGELLAARQIEGTRQFFTRAFDFGYTRSLQETFERWPRPILQRDAVRAVRRFRPRVVVAVFPDDSRAGHGQHQAAGVIARDLFELAGQPDRFPDLTAAGLPPWQPEVLYRRAWRDWDETSLQFPLEAVDPLTGKSVLQIASASRSQHRSQDMGMLQGLGARSGGLIWLAGKRPDGAGTLFGNLDTRLSAIAGSLPEASLQKRVASELEQIEEIAERARRGLSPVRLAAAVAPLAEIVSRLRRLQDGVRMASDTPSNLVVADLLAEKLEVASVALAAAAGVAVDAVTNREAVVLGGSLDVTATVWNSGSFDVTVDGVEIECREGWRASSGTRLPEEESVSGLERRSFELTVGENASPTLPYFLQRERDGDLYDWSESDESAGTPIQDPPAIARFLLEIEEVPVELRREVVYQFRDQASGEVRRPLRAVPPLEIAVQPRLVLWPIQAEGQREIEMVLRSNSQEPLQGRVELRSDTEWPEPSTAQFSITEARGQQRMRFPLARPRERVTNRIRLTATATLATGEVFRAAYPSVRYPHIRPMAMPVAAHLEIQLLDLTLPRLRRIGYIRGASDRTPEVLREVGLPVELLSAAELETGDLSIYDVIVVGSRAYEVDSALAQANPRLLHYTRSGGVLLVQYQQYQFVSGDFTPLPLEIARPHGRVTDEHSAVRILRPEHVVFQAPNRISDQDWHDWVQERGLYFASEWHESFIPLLALQDEGQPEQRGALLVAPVGDGTYIYTGLSFFRELPAGVPGALRLFVNLLALGER